MATISVYQTTGGLLTDALDNNPYLSSSLGDLLRNSVVHFSAYNANMASEYQAGFYDYGIAVDGSFVVETLSYYANFYGSISLNGSQISSIIFEDKVYGNVLQVDGYFSYQSLPFLSSILSASFTKLTETYNISSNLYVLDILEGSGTITPGGAISGTATVFSEFIYDSITNQGGGYILRGSASYTGNTLNPYSAAVQGGKVTSFGTLLGQNYVITDSIIGDGLNWSLSTKFSDVVLNAGNDTYTFSGTVGGNVNAGTGNDSITGGIGNDFVAGSYGNDFINGGDGFDTAVFSGPRSSYSLTKAGSEYVFVDLMPNRDGTERLVNVEFAQFADGTFLLNDQFINETSITKVVASGLYTTAKGQTVVSSYGLAVGNFIDTYTPLFKAASKNYVVPKGILHVVNYSNGEIGVVIFKSAKSVSEQKFFSDGMANGKASKLTLDQVFSKEKSNVVDLNGDGFFGDVVSQTIDADGDPTHADIGLYKLISGRYAIGESSGSIGENLTNQVILMSSVKKAWMVTPTTTILGISENNSGDIEILTKIGSAVKAQVFDEFTGLAVGKAVLLRVSDVDSREYVYGIDLNGDSIVSLVGQESPPSGW